MRWRVGPLSTFFARPFRTPIKMLTRSLLHLSVLACFTSLALGECVDSGEVCNGKVPRLVKFGGVLKDSTGRPQTGVVGIRLAIYSEPTGGQPLWQEIQNVRLDQQGKYTVLLGATSSEGLPMELFASEDPRWLGVEAQLPEETERPRVLLVSVPYALQAGNAETLGGFPPSAFVRTVPGSSAQKASEPGVKVSSGSPPALVAGATGTNSAVQTGRNLAESANGMPQISAPNAAAASRSPASSAAAASTNTPNILYAEEFPGGVPEAIAECPAPGCVIYAYSQNVNRNLGTINPVGKSITLYLGPFTYNIKQLTLQGELKVIGMGAGGTILQSVNGNNPVVVVPQAAFSAAANVLLSGFRLVGSVGNTSEDAMLWDSSGFIGSGVWYSELRDISIIGFAGNSIHIKGTSTSYTGMSQFVQFDRVTVWRVKGGGNALRVEGAAYKLSFNDCQFDGTAPGDGTNIFLGASPGSPYAVPTNISFTGLTTQLAATAVQIDGGWAISFYSPHHEYVWGVYSLTGNTGAAVRGLTISDAGFQASGVNGGAGYLLKVTNPAVSGVRFTHNHIMGPADAVVLSPPGTGIVYQDNQFFGTTDLPGTKGITMRVTSDSSISIGGAHTIGLTSSTTPITKIHSSLGAGETATFFTINGRVTFAAGGNINLMGAQTLSINGSITFVVSDLGPTPSWVPISQWQALPPRSLMIPLNTRPGSGAGFTSPPFSPRPRLSSHPKSLE
jgi:hypothetical protein